MTRKGWRREPARHSLASRGVRTRVISHKHAARGISDGKITVQLTIWDKKGNARREERTFESEAALNKWLETHDASVDAVARETMRVPPVTPNMRRLAYESGSQTEHGPDEPTAEAAAAVTEIISLDPRYSGFEPDDYMLDGPLDKLIEELETAFLAGYNGESYPFTARQGLDMLDVEQAKLEAEDEKKTSRYIDKLYLPDE